METRTNHFLVGAFVLLLVAGLGAFIIWAVKADVDAEHTNYHVYFAGSVSGLSKVSEVRYRGVPIGTVTDIRIDPDNVERVRVTLDVSGDTVIKEDSIASIEMQGITGVAIVQISGGRQSSPALEARPGEVYPVIQSKRSSLEKLFSDTPELINRILTLVETVTRIFDDKNIAAIGGMLANAEVITAALAGSMAKLDAFLVDASGTARELRATAKELRGDLAHLTANADATLISARATLDTIGDETAALGGDARALIADLRGTARSLGAMSDEIQGLVADSRGPIDDFTAEGLYDFARLVAEMRTLVASLSRIADDLESDPSGYLFGGTEQGFKTE
ncbi:MAG: MlaD family protein [Alphaproteobacteria bacterium]|jgi:phospholipid/cholesterol/gamma-HCH transport system substrate-binding protein|nr:MlaD family protein [Alphaproteobacteria bacterium]MDP6818106.1 MlaD family protein [Alphaproteobacteria bacterium]|tara:strand:- start:76 stop:1083 length:1008 start_codon:yes stop_codon:yes gene_type:complete